MAEFVAVAKVGDIALGAGKTVDLDGTPVAIFNHGEGYLAVHGTCPHAGGPLGDGEFDGVSISCPWHDWMFDARSGRCLTAPGLKIPCFDVRVEGDDILIAPRG